MGERMPQPADPAEAVIAELTRRGLRIAVAESLTGGLVMAELTRIPGASVVVNGGVVAYDTDVKRSLLGVSAGLLEREGAVHPEVARQMADRVRHVLAVDGRPADLGIATTGVAGPTDQDGKPAGTVYLGVAIGDDVEAIALDLHGDRAEIRAATVRAAIGALLERL
ncbi:CinA family protein [Agromyces bauzanensis]|uniref:Competence damage-inducible protein A n=1 Tax=Agromyces bauzanensis TaxID=1308924 RepID=A0A917UR90_9MICO|nr:competence damage-inducible protein A [Agromyces bauzanensis]